VYQRKRHGKERKEKGKPKTLQIKWNHVPEVNIASYRIGTEDAVQFRRKGR